MKIAVEDWELYNGGILLCKWFDLDSVDTEDIEKEVSEIKSTLGYQKDTELFVADYEDSRGIKIDSECISTHKEINDFISDLDEDEIERLKIGLTEGIFDLHKIEDIDLDSITFISSSIEDLAQEIVESYNLPDFAMRYFDYDSFQRDLSFDYYITDSGVYSIE